MILFFPRTSPGKTEIECSASEKIFQGHAERPVLSRGDLKGCRVAWLQALPCPSLLDLSLGQGGVCLRTYITLLVKSTAAASKSCRDIYGCRLSKSGPQPAASVPSGNLFEMQIPRPPNQKLF